MSSGVPEVPTTEVLIVGAGPTGLMLACWLTRCGVRVRIIDSKPGPTQETRAIAVQARTLEFYDQLGLGEQAHRAGREVHAASIWVKGRNVARAVLSDMGQSISPHPYFFILTQDRNEAILLEDLRARGVEVEWNTALTALHQDDSGVTAGLTRHGTGTEAACRYLCGCDGARSVTRHLIGASFPGGTYAETFYVADVVSQGELREGDLNLCLDDDDFQAFFPMPGVNHQRIVGLVPASADEQTVTFEDVRASVEGRFSTRVEAVHWFATYRVHHRVAQPWRQGRAFLLGDAAHVHSPVGGQGMNTGLGDAVNLAWKLAAVLRGHAVKALLDTFEAERQPFAETLVETTDRAFTVVVSPSVVARLVRTWLLPLALPRLVRRPFVRRLLFRTVSQTRLHYAASPLSVGRVGRVQGGDRLPWVPGLYEALRDLKWHLFVVGSPGPEALGWAAGNDLGLHPIPWTSAARQAGYREGSALLVRPDGYVGLIQRQFAAGPFTAYWKALQALRA
jgi:2-polyprenyl-6-methoxyphenol hydroxylase-like FAD-dependent oxidoreductase